MKRHRNTRGEPLEFEDYFYLLDILADPSPRLIIRSAVQTGKTEVFICKMLADTSLGLSCFYVLPTQDSRNIFVPNRINRMFNRVPYYRQLVRSSDGQADSFLLKHIGKGVVRFGSSQTINEFKEFPADVLYVDEFDQCEPDGISYAFDRCKGSPYKFENYLGNPTVPGNEFRRNIDWMFQNSDAKMLHYECPNCTLVQPMSWWDNIVRTVLDKGVVIDYELRDEGWELGCERDIIPKCKVCDSDLLRDQTCVGWVATGNPNHPVSGYHLSRLSPLSDRIDELYERFRPGITNPSALRTFTQSDLGEPFEGGVGNKLTAEVMERCAQAYEPPASHRGPTTMGIDVGDKFDVRVSDYHLGEDGKILRRLIYVDRLSTDDQIFEVMRRFNVAVCVIDSQPEARVSKLIQTNAPCKVWRCAYHPVEGSNTRAIRWDSNQGQGKKKDERMVWADRTEAMDSVYSAYLRQEIIEPPNFKQLLRGRYLAMHTAPSRQVDQKSGRPFWIKCNDHAFHANVYDWLASQDPQAGLMIGATNLIRGRRISSERFSPTEEPVAVRVRQKQRKHRALSWEALTS